MGLEDAQRELHSLLEGTIQRGENHSVIVVGFRGGGKSVLLRHTLARLRREHAQAAAAASSASGVDPAAEVTGRVGARRQAFVEVYLNGSALHDDNAAMHEIVRQLSSEGSRCAGRGRGRRSAFHSNLAWLVDLLREGARAEAGALPTIFVLDEFDAFAARAGAKQAAVQPV